MRAVIIGMGSMGLRHFEVAISLGLEVVGVADGRPEALANARAKFPVLSGAACFTDGMAMLAALRPEVVVIATTAPSHCLFTCSAAENGARWILCEKPLAVSLDQCRQMIETCRKAGAQLAVNHQMRFMEQYTATRDLVQSEAFGGLSSMTVSAGNFGIAMNGSHYFEAFRYLTDEAAVLVSARFSAGNVVNPRGAQFLDRAGTIRLETATGKRFYMDASADQGHGMHVVYAGPYGRLAVDELAGRMQLVWRKAEHRAMPSTRYGMPYEEINREIAPTDAVTPTRAVLQAFLNDRDYPDGEIGRRAVEILVACYLSDEADGKAIHLGRDALPTDRMFPWA